MCDDVYWFRPERNNGEFRLPLQLSSNRITTLSSFCGAQKCEISAKRKNESMSLCVCVCVCFFADDVGIERQSTAHVADHDVCKRALKKHGSQGRHLTCRENAVPNEDECLCCSSAFALKPAAQFMNTTIVSHRPTTHFNASALFENANLPQPIDESVRKRNTKQEQQNNNTTTTTNAQ
jgi:hypothetical protein